MKRNLRQERQCGSGVLPSTGLQWIQPGLWDGALITSSVGRAVARQHLQASRISVNVSWRSKNWLFHREGKERTKLPCCSKQRCCSGILCMIVVMQRWGQKAELQLSSNHNNSDDSDSPLKDNSQTNQDSAPNTIERLLALFIMQSRDLCRRYSYPRNSK